MFGKNYIYFLTSFTLFFLFCCASYSQIQISTVEELQSITYNGNYVLTQDIDASSTSSWNGGEGFQPIGSYSSPFCGTFDGQGHKITGLYINRPSEENVGIFRYVATHIVSHGSSTPPDFYVGKVQNLSIVNAQITGSKNVGCVAGIAQRIGSTSQPGYNERHLIENVTVINSKIEGLSLLGGIVGKINEGKIQNCFTQDIFIFGSDTMGGITGFAGGTVQQCCSTGLVYGKDMQIGGLVGTTSSFGNTIFQCFSICWTFGKNKVGGLVGSNTINISECYSAGFVYGKEKVGGLVGDGDSSKVQKSFWDLDATQQSQSMGGTPLNTSQMLTPDVFQSAEWDGSVWGQNSGITRPYLSSFSPTSEELTLTISTENGNIDLQPTSPYHLWSVINFNLIPNSGYKISEYEIYSGTDNALVFPSNLPLVLTMSSSTTLQAIFLPDQPITINSIDELQKIGEDIYFPANWSYIIGSDIDASETETWNDGKGFLPICKPIFSFSGKLNGNNKTISNLHINQSSDDEMALFNRIDTTGEVFNLTISTSTIQGNNYVAPLVSTNYGKITNVRVKDSQVQGNGNVGGIVANNYGEVSFCEVKNTVLSSSGDYIGGICSRNRTSASNIYFSSSDCAIEGNSYLGGIVGLNEGLVQKCWTSGSITGYNDYIGGLIGMNNTMAEQCYSHSNISYYKNSADTNPNVGGLIGFNYSSINESYSTGSLTNIGTLSPAHSTNAGGLVGAGIGTVVHSFWDTETSGLLVSAGGTGKTTAEMYDRATFESENWNFESTWNNDNNTTYPYLMMITEVPSVIGMSFEDATNTITSALLTVGEVEYQCSDSVPYGVVMSSEPMSGTVVPLGSSINLVVSSGACPPPTYVISTLEDLQLIGNSGDFPLDGIYELSQDIDASETSAWNGGLGFSPIGSLHMPFTGYFDGKNYKIMNLKINRTSEDGAALFEYVENATIKNLNLENLSISGKNNTGGLIGYCVSATIQNITATGIITGKGNLGGIIGLNQGGIITNCSSDVVLNNSQYNSNTGGIVGQNQNIITQCFSIVNILVTNTPYGVGGIAGSNGGFISYCTSLGTIKASDKCGGIVGTNGWAISNSWSNVYLDGQNYMGGLIGKNEGGTVENSFATGTVKGMFYSGGLIGALTGGTVKNCYSIGKISGSSGYKGGLIGFRTGGETTASFWNLSTSQIETSAGGTGKSTVEMLQTDTYSNAGWDFDNVWFMPEKLQSYPQLRDMPTLEFINIPQLVELNQEEATNILSELGLSVGDTTVQCNSEYIEGTVLVQKPTQNNIVAPLYPVSLTVSSGPCPTNVPNLIGLTVEQVETALANANLSLGNVSYQCSNQYDNGTVFIQSPVANVQVAEGSTVDITVSQGPCMTIVPYVCNLTQAEAEALINTNELSAKVETACNNEVAEGIVFSQNPAAETQVITGSVVTIYVSNGPCPEGVIEGDGIYEGEGITEGDGIAEGEGVPEGEGVTEGEGIVEGEGTTEGEGIAEGEGVTEGEGIIEGEGITEGEVITHHSADANEDGNISLGELLRVIQFFNTRGYHCETGTEDNYAPGIEGNHDCQPHTSDYNPQDWQISLEELLRLIQIFNIGHYYLCPGESEDGICF